MRSRLRRRGQYSTQTSRELIEAVGVLARIGSDDLIAGILNRNGRLTGRGNQALARRLKAAKLRGPACVEDIDYRAARGLDKSMMRALAKDSAWVRNHKNIFVLGPTGVGKSFIALALAQKACRDGHGHGDVQTPLRTDRDSRLPALFLRAVEVLLA